MLALLQRALDGAEPDDRQRTGGRRDDDVEFSQARGELGQTYCLCPKARRQLLAAIERPIRDRHCLRLPRSEMGRGQLDHVAGADEQDLGVAQVLEQLRGESHGRGGHADRVAADLRRAATLFGDCE